LSISWWAADEQYVEMYLKAATQAQEEAAGGAAVVKPTLVHEIVNKRWEVAFALSNGEPQQVSFANSIATTKGGTHVDMIATSLANKLYVASIGGMVALTAGWNRSRRRTRPLLSNLSRSRTICGSSSTP